MSKIKGYVHMKRWTPKIAAGVARRRVDKIKLLLQEIADIYGDVYQPVVTECDMTRDQLCGLEDAIGEAEETGAEL